MEDDDRVFRALADPSRRLLLDQLFERDGRTLSELESLLPMTRFGVMKHLRVLEEAGLVASRKAGREKLHFLNKVPIQLLYDRWIGKYDAARTGALADLKTALEGGNPMSAQAAARPRLVYEVFIKAPPERIWDAITKAEFTSRYFYGSSIRSSLSAGSPLQGFNADGTMEMDGSVIESVPPLRLIYSWRSLWSPEMAADKPSRVTWELEPMGEVTKLTVVHDDFDGETATYKAVAGGWMWILSNLKTLLETGEPMPEPSA